MPNNFPYKLNIPFATHNPSTDQPDMETNNNSISQLISIDHIGFNVNGSGIHKQVTLLNEAAPGLGDGSGTLFANVDTNLATNSWPYWQNALGTFQIFGPNAISIVPGVNNGYATLPGGMYINWGIVPAGSFTGPVLFATPPNVNFPNVCWNVQATVLNTGNSFSPAAFQIVAIEFGTVSKTQFNYFNKSLDAVNNQLPFFWVALGA